MSSELEQYLTGDIVFPHQAKPKAIEKTAAEDNARGRMIPITREDVVAAAGKARRRRTLVGLAGTAGGAALGTLMKPRSAGAALGSLGGMLVGHGVGGAMAGGTFKKELLRRAQARLSAQEKSSSVKTAAAGTFIKTLTEVTPKYLAAVGATALVGAGVTAAGGALQSLTGAVSKALNFRRMVKEYPDLKDYGGTKLRRHFDILSTYGPSVAKNPTLAAGWIRTVSQYQMEGHDYVPPETVKGLIDIENGITTIQSKGLISAMNQNIAAGVAKSIGGEIGKGVVQPSRGPIGQALEGFSRVLEPMESISKGVGGATSLVGQARKGAGSALSYLFPSKPNK